MAPHLPLVSVIVPAYNAEAFIGQTLNSVLAQSYDNIEVLVVDDGSQDRTAEVVEVIAQTDRRVTLLRQANAGVAAARNLAIQKSSGEYIAPLDADDIWYPQKLEKQVKCILQAEPSVGLVYAWSLWIDEEGSIISMPEEEIIKLEGEVYTLLLHGNIINNASAPLVRRTCLEQIGYYNCQFKEHNAQGCEDWDLYLRIAEFYQFRVVPEFLIGYRQVIGSMASNCMSMARSYELLMANVQQKHPENSAAIYHKSSKIFYTYLLWKSCARGDHWSTLICIYKALKRDYTLFLNSGMYITFIGCLLKLVAKPVTSLIWQDHRSWVQFKQRVRFKR